MSDNLQQSLRPPSRPAAPATCGKRIRLYANHFHVEKLPSNDIHHYDVTISPEKIPKKLNKAIIAALLSTGDQRLGGQRPVYDGTANMYCSRPFPFDREKVVFEVTLVEEGSIVEKRYQVALKWVSRVSMTILKQFLGSPAERMSRQQQSMIAVEDIQPTIQALDVILRYGPASRYIAVGRSFFSPPDSQILDLGGGMAVWRGFHLSMRPSMWGLQLNIDVSSTAFYKGLPVIDFVKEVMKDRNMRFALESGIKNDRDRMVIKRELKGLKVEVTHLSYSKTTRVIDLSSKPANQIFFKVDDDQREISVADYMKEAYNIVLKYPSLPCLQVGAKEKKTFYPFELCKVASGQRVTKKLGDRVAAQMIKGTAQAAPDRKATVMEKLRQANLNGSDAMKEFGISVNQEMVKVGGRVLDAPKIRHGGATARDSIVPRNGVWDYRGKKLRSTVQLKTWVLFNFDTRVTGEQLSTFFKLMVVCAADDGIVLSPSPAKFNDRPISQGEMEKRMHDWYAESVAANNPIQMFFLVLPGRTPLYGSFKRHCDVELGIPSQCIQGSNVLRATRQLCHNLLLKMNAKLGGINFVIEPDMKHPFFQRPVIVMGADVTHPGIGNTTSPSIAAVVGSLDSYPIKYGARVGVQKHRQEVIADLQGMTRALLVEFYGKTRAKPERIIFYRDGVSEGQFQFCLSQELVAIRNACLSLDKEYQPGITFITVQKRHHTRFFCADRADEQGKGRNLPAGTVVDSGVVHPTDHDFFLCSHFGIQGTSRPAHYYVLWDDNHFEQDSIQALTYQLCHTYARCARSVSIPAPAYYAHLVAFRARFHVETVDGDHYAHGPSEEELRKAVTIQKASFLSSMYFA